jgi:hypothetical protein
MGLSVLVDQAADFFNAAKLAEELHQIDLCIQWVSEDDVAMWQKDGSRIKPCFRINHEARVILQYKLSAALLPRSTVLPAYYNMY